MITEILIITGIIVGAVGLFSFKTSTLDEIFSDIIFLFGSFLILIGAILAAGKSLVEMWMKANP